MNVQRESSDVNDAISSSKQSPTSIGSQLAKGNTATLGRMRALLKDFAPKTNHHFCPPIAPAGVAGTSANARARAAI
jgi:hypothetical protein